MREARRLSVWVIAATAVSGLFWACGPPDVQTRRTSLAPTPQPPVRQGRPLRLGEIRATGHIQGLMADPTPEAQWSSDTPPDADDAGLMVPGLMLGGSLYGSPWEGLEVGGQLQYAAHRWAKPAVTDIFSIPDGDQRDMWIFGVGGRYTWNLGDLPLAIGLALEINVLHLQTATFSCLQAECVLGQSGQASYAYVGTTNQWTANVIAGAQLTWRPDDFWSLYLVLGLENGVLNDGFDTGSNVSDDALGGYLAGYAGLGIEFDWRIDDVGLFWNWMLHVPIHFEGWDVPYHAMMSAQLGMSLYTGE